MGCLDRFCSDYALLRRPSLHRTGYTRHSTRQQEQQLQQPADSLPPSLCVGDMGSDGPQPPIAKGVSAVTIAILLLDATEREW